MMFCSSMSRRWLPLARISCIAIGDIVNTHAETCSIACQIGSTFWMRYAVQHMGRGKLRVVKTCMMHVRRQAGRR